MSVEQSDEYRINGMTYAEWLAQDILDRLAPLTSSQADDDEYGPNPVLIDDAVAEIKTLRAHNASLRASLDDARAEIARLSGEKHARDVALRRVIEAAESVHRPKGEKG